MVKKIKNEEITDQIEIEEPNNKAVLQEEIVAEVPEKVVVEEEVKEPHAEESSGELEEVEEEEEDLDRTLGEWFIIQTYSGQEYKVKQSLEQRIRALQLEEKIYEILIPEEDIIEVKNNKKIERSTKMYPGYIFVRMLFDSDLWYMMKRIPGLSKFMGNQLDPLPVKDEEMLKVLRQVGVKVQKYQIDFEIGDMVKIIAGPFRGYTGPVKEINMEKGKLKSMLLIFGRETPVEIDFDQVEKASK